MPNNLQESYEIFKKAYAKLKEFIETDRGTEKDIRRNGNKVESRNRDGAFRHRFGHQYRLHRRRQKRQSHLRPQTRHTPLRV